MNIIGVIGAGTMGHGIAQVCAMAGYTVRLTDNDPAGLERGLEKVAQNLDKGVARGKVTEEVRASALAHLSGAPSIEALSDGADLVIEAVPEILELKRSLFGRVAAVAPATCILGTNTSSLSIAGIAQGLPHPERVIGTHFFNPVHIMALLEVIVAKGTSDATLASIKDFGERIGKQVITVQDVPGFATSRLGVALGMEAIRMVESGVASAEDIDKAMVLGYRHPVGPLKLTDMVGLDVRMHIGEYLAKELDNPAFKPPALMRKMVAEGHLGRKCGQGFYTWDSGSKHG
ncbi:MAG: 3-hydroxyacyl-CoA dehydrogenase family protein [Myxococcota bacterium]